jgi:hypothetical protein
MTMAGLAAVAVLILIAVGAAVFIRGPWVAAAIVAAISGIIGAVVADSFGVSTSSPEKWFGGVYLGSVLGVMAGALVGVSVVWVKIKEWWWDDTLLFLFSAFIASFLLAPPALILFWLAFPPQTLSGPLPFQ